MTPEEYAKAHQKAFRIAFDFLNTHFPPGEDDEWWIQSAKDVGIASDSSGNNVLAMELLNGVMNYLGQEYKRRTEHGKTED
jgi:hypothetical protein